MTQKEAQKHSEVIEAFISGKDVQKQMSNGSWLTENNPKFSYDTNYRVKPKFIPNCGDKILVRTPFGYADRVFVRMTENGNYECLNGSGGCCVVVERNNKVELVTWEEAKPLK